MKKKLITDDSPTDRARLCHEIVREGLTKQRDTLYDTVKKGG
jgi:hypothetical protein